MLTVETLHPSLLSAADAALWRSFAAEEDGFANPLLGPEFAQAVGKVREDARVAVVRRAGEIIGFLPFHRRPGGLARPIGSPLSDYHGLISRPETGLRIADVLRAAEVSVFRYSGLIDPHGVFPTSPETDRTAYLIDLNGTTAEAYLEAVRAESPKKIKNYRRLDNKLDREVGEVRLVAGDMSRDAFNLLIDWKRDQLARTGGHDFLRADWTRELMADLFTTREGEMRGLMINLYAGDLLVIPGSPRPTLRWRLGHLDKSSFCEPLRPCRSWVWRVMTLVPATITTSAPMVCEPSRSARARRQPPASRAAWRIRWKACGTWPALMARVPSANCAAGWTPSPALN